MLRNSSFSEFYHYKKREAKKDSTHSLIDGSLAKKAEVESCQVICRAPSRTWWEQGWSQTRRR